MLHLLLVMAVVGLFLLFSFFFKEKQCHSRKQKVYTGYSRNKFFFFSPLLMRRLHKTVCTLFPMCDYISHNGLAHAHCHACVCVFCGEA